MADQRCEITDLLVDQCAHCRKLPDPVVEDDEDSGPPELGPWFAAGYRSYCSDGGEVISPGERIRADGQGGYLCSFCGIDETDRKEEEELLAWKPKREKT